MILFSERINTRISKEELKDLEKIVSRYKGLYDNKAHFFRCAVIKLINEHKNKGD